MRLWDLFFSLVMLTTLMVLPYAFVFDYEEGNALFIINESIWLLAFFINMNRVDPIKKRIKFKDTFKAYLWPWMILDASVLIAVTTTFVLGKNRLSEGL